MNMNLLDEEKMIFCSIDLAQNFKSKDNQYLLIPAANVENVPSYEIFPKGLIRFGASFKMKQTKNSNHDFAKSSLLFLQKISEKIDGDNDDDDDNGTNTQDLSFQFV